MTRCYTTSWDLTESPGSTSVASRRAGTGCIRRLGSAALWAEEAAHGLRWVSPAGKVTRKRGCHERTGDESTGRRTCPRCGSREIATVRYSVSGLCAPCLLYTSDAADELLC